MAELRVILATRGQSDGTQRKLAWFKRSPTDLYFEVGGCFFGSHTSYHKDGNIFRTSPATGGRAIKQGTHLPLADFQGWHQLGVSMVLKSALSRLPPLKARDTKRPSLVHAIDVDAYPSDSLNFVVELLAPDAESLLSSEGVQPPCDADMAVIRQFVPWLVLTTLGHDHNQVVRPAEKGFVAKHFNSRFSANRPGQLHSFEAYRYD